MDPRARNRWGIQSKVEYNALPPPSDSEVHDEVAITALINAASARSAELEREQQTPSHSRLHQKNHHPGKHSREGRGNAANVVEDDNSKHSFHKRQKWNTLEKEANADSWGSRTDTHAEKGEDVNKIKPDFGLSGALAMDSNTGNICNGVTLKFSEPPEARIPNTRWRLYVFRQKTASNTESKETNSDEKEDDLIDIFHISRQSVYLFGRDRKVADIPVDHPSLSKQHAVIQYRTLPSKDLNGTTEKLQCKPYLMDLESTNGTFINGVRIDSARYYELRRGDVIKLGASSREYVLLTEQSAKNKL